MHEGCQRHRTATGETMAFLNLSQLIAVALTQATSPPSPALPATTPWRRERAPGCVVSRTLAAVDGKPLTLGIRSMPVGAVMQMIAAEPAKVPLENIFARRAKVSFAGRVAQGFLERFWVARGNDRYRLTTVTFPDGDALIDAGEVRVSAGVHKLGFVMQDGATALDMLSKCNAALRARWNIPADPDGGVVTAAKPINDGGGLWLKPGDYPTAALRGALEGATRFVWAIGTTGRVEACHLVHSSRSAELGAVACRVVTERGRYEPARDAAGRPITSWAGSAINWIIADG